MGWGFAFGLARYYVGYEILSVLSLYLMLCCRLCP